MEIHINFVAVLVAVIANFILGFLWYTPLFGKAWAKEMKFETSVKPPSSVLIKGMIFMVIGNFLMAFVLAHNIAAWGFVPEVKNAPLAANIISSSVFTWLGFYVPMDVNRVAWEGASWKLFFINAGYHLMMLFVASTILMMM